MPSSSAAKRAVVQRDRLVDTLMLARRKHPGGRTSLDDLCTRYGIDNSQRTKHGALLDAELLAEVYVELIGARQARPRPRRRADRGVTQRRAIAIVRVRPQPLAAADLGGGARRASRVRRDARRGGASGTEYLGA